MRKGNITNEKENIELNSINANNINVSKNRNNKKDIIKFFIWMVVFIFVYYQIYTLVTYTLGKRDKSGMWLYNGVNKIITSIVPKGAKETTEDYNLKLAALGDIYTSSNILKGAKVGAEYNFIDSFKQTKDLLSKYDAVIASLNTPVAGSKVGYSTKTVYNAPDELLETIKSLGISVLASAGNHSMDKNEDGIKTTIDKIATAGLKQVGLSLTNDRTKPYVIDKNSIKVGILSYMTTSKVKISKTKSYLVNELTEDNLKSDMQYLKSQNVDYIICYLNMSNEDNTMVVADQKNNVDMLFDSGVNVVLGTGSKVVQDKLEDMYELPDKTNNHVYVLYSLGDFLGDMDTDNRKISIGADITFTKNVTKDKNGNVVDNKTKKNMVINKQLSFYTKVTTTYKITNYPIDITLYAYNQDKIQLDAKDYKAMQTAQDNLKTKLK